MKADLPFVLQRNVLPSEGGYCWDAGDPGGPTKYGITCFDLAEHRGQKMDSMQRWAPIVKAMTLDEAMDIYDKKYAVKCRFDDLPSGLDYSVIDYGINSGVARPPRVLAALLGLPARSTMDDVLMNKIYAADVKALIHGINQERLHFMHQIRGGDAWARFGKGWGARVQHVDQTSITMVDHPIVDSPTIAPSTPVPADHPLSQTVAPIGTGGRAIHTPDPEVKKAIVKTTGGSAAGSQIGHFLQQYQTEILILGGTIVLVGAAAYAWHVYNAHRKNRQVILPPGVQVQH
jgi:lysozyme family protein